ncbi:hypothetical protein BTJ39_16095 [Izhakiella australiensis]|uniref:Uncharacterized protein n=1 Tax=Izhakiella australiensis TaxID=1926881 RepID=A0A1S8YJM3_9GAMM|nr:hypothetical protein BTJ39_16095 [Izhakiella australiensis]
MAWRTAIPGRESAEISRAFSSPVNILIALSKKTMSAPGWMPATWFCFLIKNECHFQQTCAQRRYRLKRMPF